MLKFIVFTFLIPMLAESSTYIKGPALVEGVTVTATAGGTTTLTKDSETRRVFTGSAAQILQLPNAVSLPVGRRFDIINKSTGKITVNDTGSNLIGTILGSTQGSVILRVAGTANGTWDITNPRVDFDQPTQISGIAPVANGGTGLASYSTGDIVYASGATTLNKLAIGTTNQILIVSGGNPKWAAASSTVTAPTIQKFTSGSGTYTTPAGVLYLRIKMVGGGGGGGEGSYGATPTNGNAGSAGAATTFGSNSAGGGGAGGGGAGGTGGAGGSSTLSSSTGINSTGGAGGSGGLYYIRSSDDQGGDGGSSAYGGAGYGGHSTGGSGSANTGGGGGGGRGYFDPGVTNAAGSGGGGGSGGYIDAQIYSPSATYSYAVGAGGAGGTGTANTNDGGAGGSGLLIVEEYYQ